MQHNVLDNITLVIPMTNVNIGANSPFLAPHRIQDTQKNQSLLLIDKPSAKLLKSGHYEPKISISRQPRIGGMSEVLKIEMNAPKILFGNNICECSDEQLPTLVKLLQQFLISKDIQVSIPDLYNAQVVSLHIGKNIILPTGFNVAFILNELAKADMKRYWDFSQVNYINNGQAMKFHSTHFELTLYDKLKEVQQKSPHRCIEEDGCYQNIPLSLSIDSTQLLRFEVRLCNSKQIQRIFKVLDILADGLTLKNIFNSAITQKINTYFWEKLVEAYACLRLNGTRPDTILRLLTSRYKGLKALQLFGIVQALQTFSIRELRMLFKDCPTFPRLLKEIKTIPIEGSMMDQVFQSIGKQIMENIIIKKEKIKW